MRTATLLLCLTLAACNPQCGGSLGNVCRTDEEQKRWQCDQARSQTERDACLKASGLR